MFKIGDTIQYTGKNKLLEYNTPYIVESYDDCVGIITIFGIKYWSYERREGEDGVGKLVKVWKEYIPDEIVRKHNDHIRLMIEIATSDKKVESMNKKDVIKIKNLIYNKTKRKYRYNPNGKAIGRPRKSSFNIK